MGSNAYGTIFKITTWGESHGKAIGVVIDGCPAGLSICVEEINEALLRRAPGRNPHTSPRKEPDIAEILSGVFEGRTTGAPISISIANKDADSSKYEAVKDLLKPGHANSSYLAKYGLFDYRGGGRASARETACRVAAGAIAKKLLLHYGIQLEAFIAEIGGETEADCKAALLEEAIKNGDSVGGVIEFIASGVPQGLGDPIYKKLEAELAYALLSIPACKGFEIGSGFSSRNMKGSEHNDLFIDKETTATNNSGGVLGGISTGMPLIGRAVFKPASSITKPQRTVTLEGEPAIFQLPEGSRHDPCVAIRAVPVVEAMLALVLADALLLNRCSRL